MRIPLTSELRRTSVTPYTDTTALVTGGASGIGRAIGEQLVARGAHVVLADIDGAGAAAAGELAAGTGPGSAEGRQLDVRSLEEFRSLVEGIIADRGSLDLLFNNAGITMGGPTHELTSAHWDHAIDVNIRGVVNGLLAAYPAMIAQGHGHIVNTASGAGLAAPPFVAPYAMTKHAVVGLSLGLRPEAALHGVKVSVLCPGSVETPILDRGPPTHLPLTTSEPVTARMYLTALRQQPIPPDRFARQALEGVARNRSMIVVPASVKSLWYLHRLSPAITERICGLIARRVQHDLIRPRPRERVESAG